MDVKVKKFVDKRHWRIVRRIQKQECLNAVDLRDYLDFLNDLQDSNVYIPFFMICLKEMERIQRKLSKQSLSQTFVTSFSGITLIFGRSLLEINCTSEHYSEIIEIWTNILPNTNKPFQEAFLINQYIFQELFDQLPKLGHIIMQWDLIGILLKYTLHSSPTSYKLLKLTKEPAYSRVRKSFKKISSNIDHHSLDILKKINEDSTEKLVVSLTAIDGYYNKKKQINAIKCAGVSQALMVHFNIGKPGISCLFDISTLNQNDTSESIYVVDIALENIRKITLNKIPYEEIFFIKIKFKSIDRNGIKKMFFNFCNSQLEHMINSNVFTVLQIRSDLQIFSAYTPSIKRRKTDQDLGRCCDHHNHSFETTVQSRIQTCSDIYVSDSNAEENYVESRNRTNTIVHSSDIEIPQDGHETAVKPIRSTYTNDSLGIPSPRKFSQGVKQRENLSGLNLIDGTQPLSTDCRNQISTHIRDSNVGSRLASERTAYPLNQTYLIHYISDSDSDSQNANEKETNQERRKKLEAKEGIPSLQKFSQEAQLSSSNLIEGIEPLSNENANNVSSNSFEIIEDSDLDSTEIWDPSKSRNETYKNSNLHSQSQSAINRQQSIPSPPAASPPAVNPKPTRRKLFDPKSYNESHSMSPSAISVQTIENRPIKVPINHKSVFHLTDDPYRVLELNYSSDELGNNLHSKKRLVNNATRFKSFRAKATRNVSAKRAELSTMDSGYSGQSDVPKGARNAAPGTRNSYPASQNENTAPKPLVMTNLVPKTDSSTFASKSRRLNSYEDKIPIPMEHDGGSETKMGTSNLPVFASSSKNSTNRIQNTEIKLAKKRSNNSTQNSGSSVNKKAKSTQGQQTSQAGIQPLDHTVKSSSQPTPRHSENNADLPVSQYNKIEKILKEIRRQTQLLETKRADENDEEITSEYIAQLILEGNRFVKEIGEMFMQISTLLAKNIPISEKVFQSGNTLTALQAEQLKQLEELKLHSANVVRRVLAI